MNIRERLMSRASVAVMAAFAPKKEGEPDTSKVGQAENVDEVAGAGGGDDAGDGLGLTAEEQAQFDAMQAGRQPGDKEAIDPGGEAAGDGEGEDGEGDEGDGAGDGAADGAAAAADGGEGEAGAAADGDAGGGGPEPTRIGYGKHKRLIEAERKRAAELQKKLDALNGDLGKEREARVRLDERTRQLLEAIQTRPKQPDQQQPAKDEDPEPDAEQDPIGHLQWRNRKLEKTVEQLTTGQQQDRQISAAEREAQQVYTAYEGDITSAAGENPVFADAFVHMRESRYRELGFFFADIDVTNPEECARLSEADQAKLSRAIKETFHKEQMEIARQELASGRRPSGRIMQMARARGFVPKADPAAGEGEGQQRAAPQGGGGQPAKPAKPANGGGAAPSVKEQLNSIREGQQGSKSLSDAGGSPGTSLTPERLAQMTDAEFEEVYNSMPKGRFDSIMGKPAQQ